MPLTVRFLGTSASRPTVERGVAAIVVEREGETLLFDCGEGTQRQMMRYGASFALRDIFFTHFHADHFLGIVGLMRTMALQGRTDALRCWGPRGAERVIRRCETLGAERSPFPVEVTEVEPGQDLRRDGYVLRAAEARHRGTPALTWALIEDDRLGRFDPDTARALGIPEGPLWGRIHRGHPITLDDGRVIEPAALVGPTRPGRRVVLTGDTRPADTTIEVAHRADLLVHEATFGDEEADRAAETGHSTAREAAGVARDAEVRRLVLTHLSARYTRDTVPLETEARSVFPHVTIARDGMEIDVPFRDAS